MDTTMAGVENIILHHEGSSLVQGKKGGYTTLYGLDEASPKSDKKSSIKDPPRTLTTFGGVFAPVALSQFSTLLFLRIGFIIGAAGIYQGFGTLFLAYCILLTTILSVSAISTNGAIEGGGVYYMISRILGPEFGGAIGVLFVCANILGSGLYNIGCIEGIMQSFGANGAIAQILPDGHWYLVGYRTLLNVFNILICCIGAGMFTKTTVVLFIIVFISSMSLIVSYVTQFHEILVKLPAENMEYGNATGVYTGFSMETLSENLYPQDVTDYTTHKIVDFATVFSVIFSGITGIMNGANMSGELKNPGFSIPVGTLSAAGFTLTIYSVLFVLTASSCTRFLLINNFHFLVDINLWAPFVTMGVMTATMSASLSKMIGASRVLQAIVKDNLFGSLLSWLGVLSHGSNPIGSVVISALCIEALLFVGHLNTVAKFTSIFFLLSHCSTNMACFCLEWASAPNFRPTFRYFSWWTALIGIFANGTMMFVVSPVYAVVCIMMCLILMISFHLRAPFSVSDWGSISQAILYHQVRKFLLLLDPRKDHVKFWRPQILLLVSDPRFSCPLIDFVNDLKKSGLYILGHVLTNEYSGEGSDPAQRAHPKWQHLVDHLKIKAFIEVTIAPSVRKGVEQLARIAGLGAMKPNTVIMGFCDEASTQNFFLSECSPFHVPLVHGVSGNQNAGIKKIWARALTLRGWAEGEAPRSKLEPPEFVNIVRDLLNLGKNVCICRHFQLLHKKTLLGGSPNDKLFIDVWPMNFFDFSELNRDDKATLFCLQMATVLHMVPVWNKKTKLRVFLCVCSSNPEDVERIKSRVNTLLHELRIRATIVVLSLDAVGLHRRQSTETPNIPGVESLFYQLPESYLKEVNLLIRENSTQTAVTFMMLPRPPPAAATLQQAQDTYYFNALSTMTQRLPPTVLAHGLSSVTDSKL